MAKEKTLCKCKKVTRDDILKAMSKGANSYKEVKEKTGVGSKCGKCKDDIKKFIEKQSK